VEAKVDTWRAPSRFKRSERPRRVRRPPIVQIWPLVSRVRRLRSLLVLPAFRFL
jgi:hypothetical protein